MDHNEQQYIDDLFNRLRSAEGQGAPRDSEAERYIQQLIGRQPGAPYYMAQAVIVQEEALKGAQQRMEEMHMRIEDLERELAERPAQRSGGGFLGGLFGGGAGSASQGGATSVPSSGSVPRSGESGGFSYPRDGRDQPSSAWGRQGQPGYGQQGEQGYGQQGYGQQGQGGFGQGGFGQQQPSRGGGFLAGAAQTAAGVAGGMMLGSMLGGMFGGDKAEAAKPEAAAAEAKPEAAAAPEPAAADPFANVQETQYGEDDDFLGGGGDFDI